MSITSSVVNQPFLLSIKAIAMIGCHACHHSSSLCTAHLRGTPSICSEAVFAYGHTALTMSNFLAGLKMENNRRTTPVCGSTTTFVCVAEKHTVSFSICLICLSCSSDANENANPGLKELCIPILHLPLQHEALLSQSSCHLTFHLVVLTPCCWPTIQQISEPILIEYRNEAP